jgi:hypothetical protein
MSSREKNLLSLLLIAGFLILNFFLYSQFNKKKTLYEINLKTANTKLQLAINNQNNAEQFIEQMEWLTEHEPTATDSQVVQGQLQDYIDKQARNVGLTVKGNQRYLPTVASGSYYHSAQIEITVSGKEPELYRWLHIINEPTAFRAATHIILTPNTQDDTLIDCKAVISQWFPAEKSDS